MIDGAFRQTVRSKGSNPAVVLAELSMRSLKHIWWQQTIDFWNALASAPASCLHKLVLIDNLQDAFLHGVQSLIAFAVLATIYLLKSKVSLS